jgi:hypothetical protein
VEFCNFRFGDLFFAVHVDLPAIEAKKFFVLWFVQLLFADVYLYQNTFSHRGNCKTTCQ